MGPPHPGQAIPLDLGDEEPFLLGPALNMMSKAFDLADELGTSAALEFRGFVIACMQSSRPKKGGPRD